MKDIRIGKDILIRWSILTNKQPRTLAGRDLRLECHKPDHTTLNVEFSHNGNIAEFTIRGIDQTRPGKYSFTMWENFGKPGQSVVDCCNAFKLVRTTCEESGADNEGMDTETVDLETSNMEVLNSSAAGGFLCIHTKKDNTKSRKITSASGSTTTIVEPYAFNTVIEGVSDAELAEMADTDKYRLVLMRWRKQHHEGSRWRIPMLPYEVRKNGNSGCNSSIAETDTWWPVSGRIVPWFRNGRLLDQALLLNVSPTKMRFCSVRNIKMRVGVALFKKTGRAGAGWTRISNIAYIELYLCGRKTAAPYKPSIMVTVRS